jgi:hypothetical protein
LTDEGENPTLRSRATHVMSKAMLLPLSAALLALVLMLVYAPFGS